MNKQLVAPIEDATATPMDWHAIAEHRLARLVDLEHDHALIAERLARLQGDWSAHVQDHLVREQSLVKQLSQLRREHADLVTELTEVTHPLASYSRRITAPLRAAMAQSRQQQAQYAVRTVRRILRLPLIRPCIHAMARLMVRWAPGLHMRVLAMRQPLR